ncbi:type IV toxin-antitoxin system AbiEi family antitoxin domain-containing protein [Rhodococcus koreensis]|uniref:type IV toxin-antitoxin system AbiEi family antitoxin domain-containing protein n=1 Tax=Rhodococcus koreensis TaxID=99653 RepID=UPI0036DF42C3
MRKHYRIIDLADLAAGQWGLFTTAQAKTLGFTTQQIARLAEGGTIERLRHGGYRISGAPFSPHEQLRAAWLLIEPGTTAGQRLDAPQPAVISHRSAARLHGLGDVDADVMEFTAPQRKQSRHTDVRYRVAEISPDRWTLVDGLPVTTVLATIDDLAADRLDGGHLAGIVRDALTTGACAPDDVITVLRPHAHRYGAGLDGGAALLDRFLAEAGIPDATRALSERITPAPDVLPPGTSSTPGAVAALNEALESAPVIRRLQRQIEHLHPATADTATRAGVPGDSAGAGRDTAGHHPA